MAEKSILITDNVPDFFIEKLEANNVTVEYQPDIQQSALSEAVKGHTYMLIRGRVSADAPVLKGADQLEAVLRPGSGLDNIDREVAAQRGIRLITSPEGNCDAVGDLACGLLLNMLRSIPAAQRDVLTPAWDRYAYVGEEMAEQTIGIIGLGHTGSAFAKRLSGFSCRVMAYDKYRSGFGSDAVEEVTLEQLMEEATVVSFHVPLADDTYYYMGHAFLGGMKRPFYLLNTSRGAVVSMDALLDGLESGKILGAGLDVLPDEGTVKKLYAHIRRLQPWVDAGRAVLSPHMGGLSHRSQEQIFMILLEKLFESKN